MGGQLDLPSAEPTPDTSADAPRTWLIGEQNPYGADPAFALYPLPENAAGARLARFLGLQKTEYLRRFVRRNLLGPGPWSAPKAREAADALLRDSAQDDRLVLLGARVSAAFGVPFRERLFDPEVCVLRAPDIRRRILVAPHPSGRSREWNDPRAPERLRAALARLESGESPS
jgi:hypothetical protein